MADSRRKLIVWGFFAAFAVQAGSAAAAQPDLKLQVFPSEYFASSRPADAYDMVSKLPGFEIIEGDEDVRGYSGSRGNVLFDGRAPSGKEETLEEALRRIPAANVLRIELTRGGATGSATGGYDLVANVIRRTSTTTDYAIAAGATGAERIGVKPDGRFELTHQSGDRRIEAALALATDMDDESGKGWLVERDLDGGILDQEARDEREVTRTASADAEFKTPLGPGEMVANLNLSRDRVRERIRIDDEEGSSFAREAERSWAAEVGAQYRASAGSGDLEALAVQRFGRLRSKAVEDDEEFREATKTRETIGRAEYRLGSERLRTFGSLEGALNRLSSDARLTEAGVEVPISGSDVAVSERRLEGAVGAIWKPSARLVIEPTIRLERSTIRLTGDSEQDETFLFWKPRLRGTWERGKTRLQLTAEREAAQLDFGDFVASAELGRDDVTAGATSLAPPTTWSISATAERRFWDGGALLLTYRQEWIDDVIDRVVIEREGELFDAVGNIGSGRRRIIRANLTVPFDRIGVPGFQFRGSVTFLKSRVTDPVTGSRRIISEDVPFEGDLRIIHDLPGGRWSWGADASLSQHEYDFRLDEIRKERKRTAFGAYVEFRPASAWRLRLEAENLGSPVFSEEREKFDGPRSTGETESIETRRLRTSPIVSFSLRRSFGGNAGQAGSEP